MLRKSRTIRRLLTTTLVASTGVAALLPLIAESGWDAVASSSESSATTCCCGTQAGGCCGMGCCTAKDAPTPERGPMPCPEDGANARIGALALVWSQVTLPVNSLGDRAWVCDHETLNRSLAVATLQAHHVRLDA